MIRINHRAQEFPFKSFPKLRGYPLHLEDCEGGSKAFDGFQFAVMDLKGVAAKKKWAAVEVNTGAVLVNAPTRKRVLRFLNDKALPVWPQYRLCIACRIHQLNLKNNLQLPESDEFTALLVAAKMEGITYTTLTKDIYATSNTTTAPLAG